MGNAFHIFSESALERNGQQDSGQYFPDQIDILQTSSFRSLSAVAKSPSAFVVLCNQDNSAKYGSCVASAYAQLDVQGPNAVQQPQNPGLPFHVAVSKLDSYGQV